MAEIDDEQIIGYYEGNIESYTKPQMVKIGSVETDLQTAKKIWLTVLKGGNFFNVAEKDFALEVKIQEVPKKHLALILFVVIVFWIFSSLRTPNVKYTETGLATHYAKMLHGRKTASGQVYNIHKLTAAHRTLPFGTKVRLTNLSNGRKVIVTINDRMPRKKKVTIDLSYQAARKLGMLKDGTAKVKIEVLSK